MQYPERFSSLPDYAFPRLRRLLDGIAPGDDPVAMTIGEPRHAFPAWVGETMLHNLDGFGRYPPNEGAEPLREAIAAWLNTRYGVTYDPATQIMPLNGTREGLYNAMMALCPERKSGARPTVLIPNPFYQVYAVAAMSVGAEPIYVAATRETGHLPNFHDLPADVLDRCAVAYLCSPANPQGAVADADYWRKLLDLAERHDFRIFADECYSEIYRDVPPPGILEVAHEIGADPERVVAFHSLSKRSNMPGLRSGFVAAGPKSRARMLQLRSYAGTPLPLPLQAVATRAWQDETHVVENRALYHAKFDAADRIFAQTEGYSPPQAGFFLWLPVEDGEAACVKLWRETGVKVLPGAYLARDTDGVNPGAAYIRAALVADLEDVTRALSALRTCLY